jgi:hypothetical protein
MNYEQKYLKYKTKYLNLKQQIAGSNLTKGDNVEVIVGKYKGEQGTIMSFTYEAGYIYGHRYFLVNLGKPNDSPRTYRGFYSAELKKIDKITKKSNTIDLRKWSWYCIIIIYLFIINCLINYK